MHLTLKKDPPPPTTFPWFEFDGTVLQVHVSATKVVALGPQTLSQLKQLRTLRQGSRHSRRVAAR